MTDSIDEDVTLSTGMGSLDNQLEGEGLKPGTVITVLSPPNSIGEHLLYNIIGEKDTFYISTARDTERIESVLNQIVEEESVERTMQFVSENPPTKKGKKLLEKNEMPSNGAIVLDPVNLFEADDVVEYREFLQTFIDCVKDSGSIGLIHVNQVEEMPTAAHRWLTLQMTDAIFSISHKETAEDIEDQLFVPKFYGSQRLDELTFKLPQTLVMDVGTKESIQA